MKTLIVLLALTLLGYCTGCGKSGRSDETASVSPVHGLGPTAHEDADGDHDFHALAGDYGHVAEEQDRRAAMAVATGTGGASTIESLQTSELDSDRDDDNHQAILSFGHTAGAADQRSVRTAVERYYRTAAAEDGAKGCALLTSGLAAHVVGEYGRTPYLHGESCSVVLSRLFERRHAELVTDSHTIEVLPARERGDLVVALLSWAGISREGQIVLLRERGRWMLDGLIDGPRPLDGEAH
jgi:hypothetical protein